MQVDSICWQWVFPAFAVVQALIVLFALWLFSRPPRANRRAARGTVAGSALLRDW